MDDTEWIADHFERHRPHLRAVAYRMLGSLAEADDAVQDTWLRLSRSGADDVENLGGWLTTITARVCLNMLRSRNRRREEPLPVHLPDPVISPDGETQPEEQALMADSVSLALLVVLDTLTPDERLAFVLHDMFDLPFTEIAAMVGRTPAAAKQLASRARRPAAPIGPGSARWSMPSSPPPAKATSTLWLPCSTPTSWHGPTGAPGTPRPRWWSAAPGPSPGRRSWAAAGPPHGCARCW